MRKEFVDAVVREIKLIVGDNAEVKTTEVFKNNTTLTGIIVKMPNETVSPTVYLENYADENDIRYIAKKIIEDIADARINAPQFDVNEVTSLDYIKRNVSFRLVNYEKNKDMLDEIPYIKFLDLAMICYVEVSKNGAYKVTNTMLNHLGITQDELFEMSKENTPNMYKPNGQNMEDMIEELMFGKESHHVGLDEFRMSHMPLYALTNEQKCFGAAVILYYGVLSTLAKQIDADLVILPSSVHETIIMPYDSDADFTYIKEMVSSINQSEVAEDEVLSDNVYLYNRYDDSISIL